MEYDSKMGRNFTHLFFFVVMISGAAIAAPSNDECTNAMDLTEGVASTDNSAGATDSGVNHCAGSDDLDVWYFYRPDESKYINVSLCGSDFDTTVALYDGCGGVEVACNDQSTECGDPDVSYLACVPVIKNRDYFVRVAGFGSTTGNISVLVEEATCSPPAEDECASAPNVFIDTPVTGSTVGATDSGAARCAGDDALDVWYRYQPSLDGPVSISLCGSDFDTTLSVFDGCGGTAIACNNDTQIPCANPLSSSIDCLELDAGQIYYIRIAGVGGTTGDYDLVITGCVPENDDCANALPLTEAASVTGFTSYATDSGAERCVAVDAVDVWYAYTAPATQTVQFTICDANSDTTLSIFDGCGGSLLDCNDDSLFCGPYWSRVACFPVVMGETYLVRVSAWDYLKGRFNLGVAPMVCDAPENDDCANALALTAGVTAYGDTTAATGTDVSACSTRDYYDIWYSYTPAANTIVDVNTCGSNVDTSLEILDACGGTSLDCGDDSGGSLCDRNAFITDFAMTGGTTYLLRVAGYAGDRGPIAVTVSDAAAPAAILITPSTVGPTNAASVTFTVKFDQAVLNFNDENDLVLIENGVTHGGAVFSGSGADYTVTVTGLDGTGTISLAISTASDVTNAGLLPLSYSIASAAVAIDHAGPVATLSTSTGSPTNSGISVSIDFDEAPIGFDLTDVTADNAMLSNFYGSGTAYHVAVAAVADGPFGISLTAGTFADALGNLNTAAPTLSRVYDGTAPVISDLQAVPSEAEPGQTVTISFSTDEDFVPLPLVTVNGHEAESGTKGTYTFTYLVQLTDPSGPAEIAITGFDTAGNTTYLESTAALTIVNPNYVPLPAWPLAIALGIAATVTMRRRRG